MFIGTVAVHYPYIIAAIFIAGIGYLFTVRTIARLYFPCFSGSQRSRLSALDRNGINIAQQIKDDILAVGTNVQVHPGALVGGNKNFFYRTGRRFHVPFLCI